MTPEQKIRNKLISTVGHNLPKGRFLLQPIETNTVGVPDFYLVYLLFSDCGLITTKYRTCWIETKTLDYNVDKFQLTWALRHSAAGGETVICTLIQLDKLTPSIRRTFAELTALASHHPTTANQPPSPSRYKPATQPQPTGTGQQPPNTAEQPVNASNHNRSGLYIINFNNKMLDYSTLGRYIEKERPTLAALEDWLKT
jgi:hypothetical protein